MMLHYGDGDTPGHTAVLPQHLPSLFPGVYVHKWSIGMRYGLFLFGVFLMGLLSSCGKQSQQSAESQRAVIRIDGSSTVYPLSEAVAEEFRQVAPDIHVLIGVSGTGGGFKKFVRGETDINDASRPIRAIEDSLCRTNGIAYIELPIAYDAMCVLVNPQNDWVDYLTVEELRTIWAPEAQGKILYWDQIRPEWPHEELHLYGPGVESGTYDYFTKAIVGKEHASRGDYTSSEDDNVIIQGVASDRYALAFVGLAYALNNKDRVKIVPIDDSNDQNGAGPILPSPETVRNGTYQPLSRPLFIYVNRQSADRSAVEQFVHFYIEHMPALAPDVGYVPLSEKAYQLVKQRFQQRITGSIFGAHGSQVGVQVEALLEQAGQP